MLECNRQQIPAYSEYQNLPQNKTPSTREACEPRGKGTEGLIFQNPGFQEPKLLARPDPGKHAVIIEPAVGTGQLEPAARGVAADKKNPPVAVRVLPAPEGNAYGTPPVPLPLEAMSDLEAVSNLGSKIP